MKVLNKKEKALVKDLELQIDYLVGYSPQGYHWKKEYYFRKGLIDNTLASDSTPPEVREKIYRIQNSLYQLRNGEENSQPYIQYSIDDYKELHDVIVNDRMTGESWIIKI